MYLCIITAIGQVTGVTLTCELISLSNHYCTVMWNVSVYTVATYVRYAYIISHCKDDIVVITWDRGRTMVKCINNDVICITGYN